MNAKNKRYSEYTDEEKEKAKQRAKRWYHANKERSMHVHRLWYDENKDYVLEQQRVKKREKKLESILYLGGMCSKCQQEFHPSVYEFHHIDPKTKDRDPSKMMSLSKEKLQKELDKCVLLCANCHRLEHHGDTY